MADQTPRVRPAWGASDAHARKTFAQRLFPGATVPRSQAEAEALRRLLVFDGPSPVGHDQCSVPEGTVDEASDAAVSEQNELLRARLDSSIETQSDARAAAQNSRTFAWAGTAIALLTLIASVGLLGDAVSGH